MFSSNNSAANPFSHFPSNFSYLPDLPFHGCHQDPVLMGHFLPTINAQIPDSVIAMVGSNINGKMPYQDIVGSSSHGGRVPSFLAAKKPMKKYRHSKICTAQGLRDRRVRLSIEIAREFFDLQDMLGFDKASETLEWLFRKSRNAIKKAQMKQSCHESGSSECDEVESGANEDDDNGGEGGSIGSKICKEKKMKKPAEFQVLAKESRSKARARARERTKEKLCTRKMNESKKCSDTFSSLLSQLRTSSSYMASSSSKVLAEIQKPIPSSHPFADFQVPRENTIEESNEIKRKLIPFSSILDYHDQNLVISKDAILNNNNNNNNSFPNLPQNWDITSSIALSSFCAITNMNLSKEVQICGKPWEAQNN